MITYEDIINQTRQASTPEGEVINLPDASPVVEQSTQPKVPAYDPGTPYLDSFRTIEQPKAPDEKKLTKNHTWGAVSDGIGILAQMFAASKGARVRPMNKSVSSEVGQSNNQVRDDYEKKLEGYNYRKMQAMLQDKLYGIQQNQRQEDKADRKAEIKESRDFQVQQTEKGWNRQDQQQEKARAQDLEAYKDKVDYQTEAEIKRAKETYPYRSTRTTSDKPQKREFTAAEKLEMRSKVESLSKEQQRRLGIIKQIKLQGMDGRGETITEELDWDAVNKLDPEILAEATGYGKEPAKKVAPWKQNTNKAKAPWVK